MPVSRRSFLRQTAATIAAGTLSKAQGAKRPNILFFIADDWSNRHASYFGVPWLKTPNFDRVAREGVVFTNTFTSNPKCSPSRATILTGRNSWQTKEAVSHYSIFPNDFPVYPSLLADAGYHVGLTGKGWGPGDFKVTGWKQNPAGPAYNKKTYVPPYKGMSSNDYAANFGDFFDQKKPGQPFCFWMGSTEPHRVYEEGSGIRAGKRIADVKVPAYWPDNNLIKSDLLDYALEVESNDMHLGRALDKLEQAGELDNTLVVVTSDHGMPFPRVKGQIYDEGFHIPLAIRYGKNIAQGRVIDDFISTRDFAPTFLELAGLKTPATMTGKSFAVVLRSGKSGTVDSSRDAVIVAKERHDIGRPNDAGYPVRAIRTREFLYVRNYEPDTWPAGMPETGYRDVDDSPTKTFLLSRFDDFYKLNFGKKPAEELYVLSTDPDCVNNQARNLDYAMIMRGLRDRMEKTLKEEGDPRLNGNAAFFETIQYTGPKHHSWDSWMKNK
jgi:N-sulfoglucosamine sulfohydrolase